jgi:hypothetical protein
MELDGARLRNREAATGTRQTSKVRHATTKLLQLNHHHDMAGTPVFHAGLASHPSLRPNLYHAASSSRVKAAATPDSDEKPSRHDKHKSHRHHHHSSRRDKEHRHSTGRRHAKEVVQSAIQLQPPTSFGDLLKQARGSKDTSPSHSRKGSIAPGADGNVEGKAARDVGITIPPRRPLRPEDVELERKRVEARERYLIPSLRYTAA